MQPRNDEDENLFDNELIDLIKQRKYEEILSIIKGYSVKLLIDGYGTHLLHEAAKYNNIRLINFFLESGIKPNIKDASKTTPIIYAIMNKHFRAAKILLAAHVDLLSDNSWNKRGKCEDQLVKDLVSEMRRRQFNSEQIGKALGKITEQYGVPDVVYFRDAVLTKTFDLHSKRNERYRAFDTVIPTFDFEHVLVLLQNNAAASSRAMSAFCSVLMENIDSYHKTRSGKEFLKRVFSWEVFTDDNFKPLETELEKAKKKNVKTFLKYNFHVFVKAKYDRDLLACLFGNPDQSIISLLDDDQIDVDGRGYDGNTPLHFATKKRLVSNMQILLDKGANPDAWNDNQQTCLQIALDSPRNSHEKCVQLLLQAGAHVSLAIGNAIKAVCYNTGESFYPIAGDEAEHVIAQLAICEANGQTAEVERSWRFLRNDHLVRMFDKCRQQLIELKECYIRETTRQHPLTIFSILTERLETIAPQISNDELQAIFTYVAGNEETLILYYRNLLIKRADDIVKINHCRDMAVQIVCNFTGIHDPNNLVVDKIVTCFSINDLRKFDRICGRQNASQKTETKRWFKIRKNSIFKF